MSERRFVDPRTLLARTGLRPKRSFGQCFLVAPPIVENIAALCVPDEAAPGSVVEIGAGLGTLTSAILARGASVAAIERDRDLVPVLAEALSEDVARGALRIVEADAATVDLESLLGGGPRPRVLAGNLPYQITGRLLERAVELSRHLDRVVVMVQREVADRVVATAGSEAYGRPSVFVQAAFAARRAFVVSAGCFHPRPEIESAVLVLTPLPIPRAEETETFRAVVNAAFGARRKTLRNALARLLCPESVAAIVALGIDLGRRGETLSVEEFATIARIIESTPRG